MSLEFNYRCHNLYNNSFFSHISLLASPTREFFLFISFALMCLIEQRQVDTHTHAQFISSCVSISFDHISRWHMRNNSRFLFINKTKRTRLPNISACNVFVYVFASEWVSECVLISFLLGFDDFESMYAMRNSHLCFICFIFNSSCAHEFIIRDMTWCYTKVFRMNSNDESQITGISSSRQLACRQHT